MLSRVKVKYIRPLELKKFRNENNVFVVKGNKLVADMSPAFEYELLIAKPSWMATQDDIPAKGLLVAEEDDIRKASFLKDPQDILATFKCPNWDTTEIASEKEPVLALDGIQDPGNSGTIIRLADWFGISHIVCSKDTIDVFSPKTIQATMGAFAHVKIHYIDLETLLQVQLVQTMPLYGIFFGGENLHEKTLSGDGILTMDNEGDGIRPAIEAFVNEKLYILSCSEGRDTSESLNVAIATAAVCAEFRRCQGNPV